MKQLLHLKSLLIAMFMLFGGGGIFAAEEESITFSEKGYSNGELMTTVKGSIIKIEFAKGSNSNGPKYYDSGTAIRAYGGNNFTVTAGGKTITQIVLGFGSSDGSNAITTDVATYSSGTWTGEAESVTFTIGGTSGNRRIASITVTYDSEQGQGTEDPHNSFTNATENATVGDPYTVQEINTLSTGRKSYASSDEAVATIDGNGNVTLKKAGETTITVTTAADDTYREGSASYLLHVAKGTAELSFAQSTVTAIVGTNQNGPELTNPRGIAVTYKISDPEIATIEQTGYIKPLKKGQATVTVTPADPYAWEASASYTLNVEAPFSVDAVGTYELVTDASSLKDGDQILISYIFSENGVNKGYVLGEQKSNNFNIAKLNSGAVSDDKSKFKVTTEKNVTAAILEGSAGAWYFHTKYGYLCATGSSNNNYLKTTQTINDNTKATITIEDNVNATVVFQGTNDNKYLRYNSGSTLFSCYKSSSNTPLPQLYRKIILPKVPISFAESVVEITYGDNYNKQAATTEGYSGNLVYTSSDETVVKFHGNNVIDVLGPGTVTITATAPATDTTEEGSATYTLKVYAPADASEALNEDFSACNGTNNNWGGSSGFETVTGLGWTTTNCKAGPGYLKLGDTDNAGSAISPTFSVVGEAPLSFALAPWIATGDNENATVNITLTNATFANGESTLTLSTGNLAQEKFTTFDQYTIKGNSNAVTITFSGAGGYDRFFLDNVVVGGGAHEINITFSSAGYLTWVATADIDFSQTEGVTAYQITEATSKKITMAEVDKVPAGAAVMLNGSGTVELKRTSDVAELANNKMLACKDGSVTGNGVNGMTNTDVYVLGTGKSGLGFYMLKGTLQAGKGYLQVSEGTGNAKPNFISFEETTGVKTVVINKDSDGEVYSLQGIRVAHPQKGIYVKNGKKYVIK